MVKITEYEYTDHNGQRAIYREIEADYCTIEGSDGSIETYQDRTVRATEQPRRDHEETRWTITGLPRTVSAGATCIRLFASNQDLLIALINLSQVLLESEDSEGRISGEEEKH